MISSFLHLVGLRPRVYYTLTNFRGGGARPPCPPPLNTPMLTAFVFSSDEYTINHALSKSPTVGNGVYETIARVPHSSPPRAQGIAVSREFRAKHILFRIILKNHQSKHYVDLQIAVQHAARPCPSFLNVDGSIVYTLGGDFNKTS